MLISKLLTKLPGRTRLVIMEVVLIASTVLWPLTTILIPTSEPIIFHLSWFAVWFTVFVGLIAAEEKED